MILPATLKPAPTPSTLRYKAYSITHRLKVRAWQLLAVLAPSVALRYVPEAFQLVWRELQPANMPSVKQYLEAHLLCWVLASPHLLDSFLLPLIRQYETRTEALPSAILVAT